MSSKARFSLSILLILAVCAMPLTANDRITVDRSERTTNTSLIENIQQMFTSLLPDWTGRKTTTSTPIAKSVVNEEDEDHDPEG